MTTEINLAAALIGAARKAGAEAADALVVHHAQHPLCGIGARERRQGEHVAPLLLGRGGGLVASLELGEVVGDQVEIVAGDIEPGDAVIVARSVLDEEAS